MVKGLVTLRQIGERTGRSMPTVHRWAGAWKKANQEAAEAGGTPPCPAVQERVGRRGGAGEKGTRFYDWAEVQQWWQATIAPPQIADGDPEERLTAERIAELRGIAVKSLQNEVSDGRFPPAGPGGTWRRAEVVAEMRSRRGRGAARARDGR